MNGKQAISRVIGTLHRRGNHGTANAIEDHVRFVERAERIYRKCLVDFETTPDFSEKQFLQDRIDVLTELFEGSEF